MTADIATSKGVLELRQRVVLAEAVMTIWLRALNSGNPDNHSLNLTYPWDLEWLDYTGASSRSPLLNDVLEPKEETVEDE